MYIVSPFTNMIAFWYPYSPLMSTPCELVDDGRIALEVGLGALDHCVSWLCWALTAVGLGDGRRRPCG